MDKRRCTWPWIVAVFVGVPVQYVASFGPACWAVDRDWIPPRPIAIAYWPCIIAALSGTAPDFVSETVWWWATLSNPEFPVVFDLVFALPDP